MAFHAHGRSLVQQYAGRPFEVLGVNLDGERETLRQTQQNHSIPWRSCWDGDGALAARWGVEGLPTVFLLDHEGIIRWSSRGPPRQAELQQQIEQLLQEMK